MNNYFNCFNELFRKIHGSVAEEIIALPQSGSNRKYYRLMKGNICAVAVYNPDKAENEAFFYITRKLHDAGVNVPEIYAVDSGRKTYLLQDLGDTDLFRIVTDEKHRGSEMFVNWYRKVIEYMPAIQHTAVKDFDFSYCYPRSAFDKQSMLWDLNYFKYHFLKLAYTPFHEQKLEDDFHALADFLAKAPSDYFLYRDFQSRNIMIHGQDVFFIDYQGGRKGALQYDPASLLFEAKTALPPHIRENLLTFYLDAFSEYSFFNTSEFMKYYPGFILIRLLQAFGAYGYRGYFERKPYFLQSIPPAITNLKWLLSHFDLGVKLPHLTTTLKQMMEQPVFKVPDLPPGVLNVSVNSFSYRKGIPEDFSGNGGGYVFDCRFLPNPGLLDAYKGLTGKDKPVVDFLSEKPSVGEFLENVQKIVLAAVGNYLLRGYEHLMINFGCTGGQHRSVYCAEKLAETLKEKHNININMVHREIHASLE